MESSKKDGTTIPAQIGGMIAEYGAEALTG